MMQISNLARLTAEDPNEALLAQLRTLEKKMGLVLTLVSSIYLSSHDVQEGQD